MNMKNKLKNLGICLIVIGLFLTSTQTISALPQPLIPRPTVSSGTFYVGGGGPGNYSTIQSAINAASNGDTIFVYAGTYSENIIIDKSLTLIGQDRNITLIQGNNLNQTIEITGEGITLREFTIKNDGTQDGIYTSTSDHTFANNVFTMTSRGIHMYYSSGNTITGSLFLDNTHSGIYVDVGQNNTISGNEFYNNPDEGIYLTGCGRTTIDRNAIHDNGIGIHAYQAEGNIISNNVIDSNTYGIFFAGMFTIHSNFNTISHNTINNNSICGLRIEHSEFNRIEFNKIEGNGKGIQFYFTGANLISQNVIQSSGIVEIELTFSIGDLIIKNNINNTQQALVLVQINFGFADASNDWWGSIQWPLRRIRPIGGWVMILPWRMNPFDLNVGPS